MNTKGDSNVNMVFLLLYFLLSQSTIPATGKAITIPKKVRTITVSYTHLTLPTT